MPIGPRFIVSLSFKQLCVLQYLFIDFIYFCKNTTFLWIGKIKIPFCTQFFLIMLSYYLINNK